MENVETLQQALGEETWKSVNTALLRKVLREFMFEQIIVPTPTEIVPASDDEPRDSWSRYQLWLTDGVEYRFDGQRRPLDSYRIRS